MSGLLKSLLAEARASGDWQRLVEAVPYARHLGVEAELVEGELLLRLPFKEPLVGNPSLQALHGGVLGGFLETAAILTLLWRLDSPVIPKTITNTVDYLRSARGLDLQASGEVTRLGRRVASVAVACWSKERQKPLASARLHFLVGGAKAP